MGLLAKIEDRPTPPCVYNYRVYLCAIVSAFASLMIGYDSAFIGGSIGLTSFKTEFGWTKLSSSALATLSANVVSTYQGGCFFGAILGYPIGQLLGRRFGLLFSASVFTIGAALTCAATAKTGLGIMYAGRFIGGLGIGAASNLTPIYMAEISPPAIRGRIIGIYELGWQFGGLVGFWINYGVNLHLPSNHTQWLIPFAVQLIPGGLMALGCLYIRESPRWLHSKGRREQAVRNLCWLRKLGPDEKYVQEELAMYDAQLENQQATVGTGFWAPFKALFGSPKLRNRLLLGGSLFIWQNATGINAINYYSPTVFKSIGLTGTNSGLFSTGIFGVIKTSCTIIWILFLVDQFGRRTLLLVGALGGGICMYAVGSYIKIADPTNHPAPSGVITSGSIVGLFFFYLWTTFYSPTWNGTPWVFNAEVFDQNLRILAQTCAATNNWFWNFIISRFTPQMFNALHYGVYFFFASLMILSIPYVWFLVPETKQIPIEDMDKLFASGLSAAKAHKVVMKQVQERNFALKDNFNIHDDNYEMDMNKNNNIQYLETADKRSD